MKLDFACHFVVLCAVLLQNTEAFNVGSRITTRGSSLRMAATGVEKKRVVIVGATGYIGKFVVKESIRRGSMVVNV